MLSRVPGLRRAASPTLFHTKRFKSSLFTAAEGVELTPQEEAFAAWVRTKQDSDELWLHDALEVRKDVATGGYGLFVGQDVGTVGTGDGSSAQGQWGPTELLRMRPSLHSRFSAAAAEKSCRDGNADFYDGIVQMVQSSIAPRAAPQQQQQLVGSLCLAMQILMVSNEDKDADLRPYFELLASNAYPHSRRALPHPLQVDSHVCPDTYVASLHPTFVPSVCLRLSCDRCVFHLTSL